MTVPIPQGPRKLWRAEQRRPTLTSWTSLSVKVGDNLIDHIELTGITGAILMDNLDVCRLADAPLEVKIDLKPGNADNVVDPFNLNSNKPVEVAVFSTADLDATTLDLSTVELGDLSMLSI